MNCFAKAGLGWMSCKVWPKTNCVALAINLGTRLREALPVLSEIALLQ